MDTWSTALEHSERWNRTSIQQVTSNVIKSHQKWRLADIDSNVNLQFHDPFAGPSTQSEALQTAAQFKHEEVYTRWTTFKKCVGESAEPELQVILSDALLISLSLSAIVLPGNIGAADNNKISAREWRDGTERFAIAS